MKKIFLFITSMAMIAINFVSCTSSPAFSSKTIEGYWWHDWGGDGYDYIYFKPNGTCDYDFGMGENKNRSYSIDSIHEIVTIYSNGVAIEKSLAYNKENDMLEEVGADYSVWRISEAEFKGYAKSWAPAYEEPEETTTTSNSYNDEVIFRSAYDVMSYLSGVSFVNSSGDITLKFKYDGLYANGSPITAAINVEEFNEVEAILTCTGIDGTRFKFHLVSEVLVKELYGGGIYYIVK